MTRLDLVNQLGRFALCRNQIKPTTGDHQRIRQAEHTVGNRVAAMMIVKQPGVNVALAQGRLNRREVHGQTIIVNKGWVLGEPPIASSVNGNALPATSAAVPPETKWLRPVRMATLPGGSHTPTQARRLRRKPG